MKTEVDFESVCLDKLSISYTCRTCLATDTGQQLTSIFDSGLLEDESPIDYFELLLLLNQKITRDDGYPANLCGICLDRLLALHAFQKQCQMVQNYLEENFVKFTDGHESKPDIGEITSDVKLLDLDLGTQFKVESSESVDPADLTSQEPNVDEIESDTDSDMDPIWEAPADDTSEDEKLIDLKNRIKEDKITCQICEKTFTTVANRNNHMYLHSDKRTFKCDQCDMSFKCKIYLRKHRKRVHTVGDHVCAECGMKFTKTSKYEYHLKTHEPEKKYKCRFCDKSFIQHYHRKSHEQTHHLEKPEKPEKTTCLCNICGKSFKHESSLKKHIQISHDESKKEVKKFQCDICKKEFIQKGSLKSHIAAHNNVRAYQCEQCGRKFTQAGTLIKHLELHNAEKSHQCEFCHESFLRIRYLRRHRLLIHGKTDVSVKIERSLDDTESSEQIQVKREEPKSSKRRRDLSYGCELCNRTFKLPSSLAAHVKTHSEERKFACNDCGNSFKKLEHLKNHINGVHLKLAHNCVIARDDGFPSKICSICLDRLVAIDNFRKQCTKVQEYLQEYFIKHRQLEETETNSSVKHPGDSEHLDPGQTRKLRSEVKAVKSEKLESSTKHTDALENDCEPKLEVNSSSDSDHSDVDASWEPHTEIKEENEVPLTGTENIKDDRVKCPICTKTFSTIASRRNHMKLHSETNAYACDECGKAFKCKRYLRIHKNTHVVGDHTCGICNEKFDNTSKYEYHFKSHTAEKKYKCRYCEKSFIYIRHRISHEKVHTKKSKSPTPKRSCLCNICGKEFKHESGLKNHMKKHDAVEKYSCDICQKEFSLKGSLKVHLLVHSNEKAYQCEQCGKKFGQVGNLNYHLALHNAKKSHKCEFCSESYLRIRDLRRHRVMVHAQTDITVKELNEAEDTSGEHETPKGAQKKPKDLPYACDLCSRSFKLPSSLASHIKVHSEDRKFVCNDCGNGFKKLEHLKMHINTVHLKTKAYSCQVCNKSFARVGDRNVHMRSHAEEKPHQCSYCGRGFHLAKALRAHTRQHTGERPFVCIICNAGFTCHKTLTSHTRKQHAGEQILSKVDEIAQAVLSAPQTEANGSSMSIVSKADTHN